MHLAPLIQDLAVIMGVATLVTYLFKVIRQPVVLGYIAAGLIVGPYTPAIFSIVDQESIQIWAELGVIFLMFALGLEFSFRKLLKLGPSAAVTGLFQILVMVVSGFLLAKGFGWNKTDAIFLGCMISISSTTIIIKAFEELKLKSQKFSDLTFGILIVEDLAAILMLVALTNFVTKEQVDATAILASTGKLILVVSSWVIFGYFLIPGLMKRVVKHGNDEMVTIASVGLCLGLVTLAAHFEYSVALGAFIMGSILAESDAVKRIEKLINPLKDVFGAVFFVSVGMLLNPMVIVQNLGHVVWVSLLIIVGKAISVFLGALATGQSIQTSTKTGLSMAQIGEFSFIIAALGTSLGVINKEIYPVIVAAALVTTFTTPYLIKWSQPAANKLAQWLPPKWKVQLDRYELWFQNFSTTSAEQREIKRQIGKFAINAAVIFTIFALASHYIPNWLRDVVERRELRRALAWVATMILISPFLWGMLNSFRFDDKSANKLRLNILTILSWVVTMIFIAFLSAEYFYGWITLVIVLGVFLIANFFFRDRISKVSRRIEEKFIEGISPSKPHQEFNRLVPWEAHLASVEVSPDSHVVGSTLQELQLREKYGINVISVNRGDLQIVAPNSSERVFPNDVLLLFASDPEIESFRQDIMSKKRKIEGQKPGDFMLRRLTVPKTSFLTDKTIRNSGIYTNYENLVVAIERNGERFKSPKSDEVIKDGDTIWMIGSKVNAQRLIDDVLGAQG